MSLRTRDISVIAVAIVFAAIRIEGFKHEAFQAFAHLFVGGLFAAYFVLRHIPGREHDRAVCFYTAAALTIVEIVCFAFTLIPR